MKRHRPARTSDRSRQRVRPHHVRDLQNALGASLGKNFEALSLQWEALTRSAPKNKK
jgi:hypothetical protein